MSIQRNILRGAGGSKEYDPDSGVPDPVFLRGEYTANQNDMTTALDIDFSASNPQPGDLIIVAVSADTDSALDVDLYPATPSLTHAHASGNDSPRARVKYAFYSSGMSKVVRVTGSNSAARMSVCVCVFDCADQNITYKISAASDAGSTGNPDPPGVSGSWGTGDLSVITGHLDDDDAVLSAPTGWIRVAEAQAGGGAGGSSTAVAIQWIASPIGDYDAGAFTSAGDDEWFATNTRFT